MPIDWGRDGLKIALLQQVVDHPLETHGPTVIRRVDPIHPVFLELVGFGRQNRSPSAPKDPNIGSLIGKEIVHVLEELDVSALVRGHRYTLRILLNGAIDDLSDRSVVTQVDHLGTGPLEDPAHDVDCSVVTIEQRARGYDADVMLGYVSGLDGRIDSIIHAADSTAPLQRISYSSPVMHWGKSWAVLILVAAGPELAGSAGGPPIPGDLDVLDPMVAKRIEETLEACSADPDSSDRWLELGMIYQAHEMTPLAVEAYTRSRELDVSNPRTWYLLAVAEDELGNLETAIDLLIGVSRLDPTYAPAWWRRGNWLAELGRTAEAEAAYRHATETDSAAVAGWIGLARIELQRGSPAKAIEILFKVLATDNANGVAGQLLGNAFRAAGDEEAARRALARATGMGAYFPDPWKEEMQSQATGVGNLLRLLSLRLERGDIDAVIMELEELHAEHPEDVGVLNKLSEGYLHRNQPDRAAPLLQHALSLAPGEFATLMHLAQVSVQRGELEGALRWVDRAIEANPRHWQAYFQRAEILGRMARYRECLDSLDTAMTLGATQNPNAWLMQGDVNLRVGDWSSAESSFEQATLRFPYLAPGFLGLAIAQTEQGHLSEARATVDLARKLRAEAATLSTIEARIEELAMARTSEP